ESRLELRGRAAAFRAVGSMGFEVRPLRRGQLPVVKAGEELGGARRMVVAVFHTMIFPESIRGVRMTLSCPRPREILHLTVPTGRPRDRRAPSYLHSSRPPRTTGIRTPAGSSLRASATNRRASPAVASSSGPRASPAGSGLSGASVEPAKILRNLPRAR